MNTKIYDHDLETAGRRLGNVSQLLLDRPDPTCSAWAGIYWRQVQARLQREWSRIDAERRPD